MDHRLKCKMQYYKASGKNKRKSLCDLGFGGEFLATHTYTHNLQYMKEKNWFGFN